MGFVDGLKNRECLLASSIRGSRVFGRLKAGVACCLGGLLVLFALGSCQFPPNLAAGKKVESQWNQPVKAGPAPEGWVNSKDGAFRVKIPGDYLDAYDAVSGQKLPDAQVILSLPASGALKGYIPALVIDHAKATSDPDIVKQTLKKDPTYKTFKDFTVLKPVPMKDLNVLAMTWKYTYQEVQMTAFMTMVFGNDHAYALKQDVPDYALETYPPVVDTVLKTWTWNQAQK